MKDDKNDPQNKRLEEINVVAIQDKMVPKFCTTISIGLLKSRNIVLTMAYSEGPDNPISLIDKIIIDLDHAKRLKDILDKILKESENV